MRGVGMGFCVAAEEHLMEKKMLRRGCGGGRSALTWCPVVRAAAVYPGLLNGRTVFLRTEPWKAVSQADLIT